MNSDEKMDRHHLNYHCTRRVWIMVLTLLIILDCYFHVYVYYNFLHNTEKRKFYDKYKISDDQNKTMIYYKYPLINSGEATMDYEIKYNSSYHWFISMKHLFKNIGEEAPPTFSKNTSMCQLNTTLGPIFVDKNETQLELIEKENPDVKLGGYYAPAHCRAINRVAVIIPYRNRTRHLPILLRYLHRLLKKQMLEYRIFVIEQYGIQKFNKGTLFNIAFLETQRFGYWHCLIFHDVDLVPQDERIWYSCPAHPTHMSPGVDSWNSNAPYRNIFGGVTALTPEQYESVNGYSNFYWDWEAGAGDFYGRLKSQNYTVVRFNTSIAQYATLSHPRNDVGRKRALLFAMSKLRVQKEGLSSTKYNLVTVTEEKLYTHILAEVNPMNIKLDTKSLMQRLIQLNGKTIVYGQKEFRLANPHMLS